MASARPRIEVCEYNGGLSPSSSDEGVCGRLLPDYAHKPCGGHPDHYGGLVGSSSDVGLSGLSTGSSGSDRSANCLTFSEDILSTTEPMELEDITSNCLLNVQDTTSATSASSTSGGQSHHRQPPTPDSPLSVSFKIQAKKKATKKVGSNLPGSSAASASLASAAAKRSKSFHTSSSHRRVGSSGGSVEAIVAAASIVPPDTILPPPSPRIIPRLQLPEDNETKSNNELFEQMPEPEAPAAAPKKRKRRKSIVNLLFPGGSKGSSSGDAGPKTPTVPSPASLSTASHGGQRLHFRRLSDFVCRPSANQTKLLEAKAATQSTFTDSPPESPKSPESTFLKQLFPHRRRRSSVAHLDHTEQFHETKQMALEATRRRMSSFPPSDGDESAVILERIHYLSTLEGDETSRAATPVSESPSPLKLLKKHLGLPGSASFNCSRWKSNVDVSRDRSDEEVVEKPSKSKPSKAKKDKNQHDFESCAASSSSNSLMPPKVRVRRNSTPLLPSAGELSSLRDAAERERDDNVIVFPKRKIEDVPGIFIPQQSKKGQSGAAVELSSSRCGSPAADDSKGGRYSHFLGVKEEHPSRRRRHSLSDPALLLKFNSPTKQTPASPQQPPRPSWLANLTPRSPYAKSSQAVLPFHRCSLILLSKPVIQLCTVVQIDKNLPKNCEI